jgi:tRNA1Val (adenine37-N6)-methyltransferase
MRAFTFKQFSVHDDRCQMKVGTDGVLLGAWVGLQSTSRALDIGTGCGLIALMMAQRDPNVQIDAIEVLVEDAQQASENVKASRWSERITVHQGSIQQFDNLRKYDLIVSNPPFFTKSMLPPKPGRASVRHTKSLSHEELLEAVNRLLQPLGRFGIILPSTGFESFTKQAEKTGLYPRRILTFQTRPGRPPERHMVEYASAPGTRTEETMSLYTGSFKNNTEDNWSESYRKLVRDFYL